MKRILLWAILAGIAAPAATAAPQVTALVGGTIVDGNGGAAIKDGVILLQGDRILATGPRSTVAIPKGATRVDVSGKWLTPGLIDAHVHFFQSGGLYTRPDGVDLTKVVPYAKDIERSKARLDETFARYLASGVTTVVDAGGPLWNFEVRRRAMASGRAPRVAVAGPLIATEPTEPQKHLGVDDRPIISAANVEEAQRLARAQLAYKPELIKIWGIGSGASGAAKLRDITRAVVAVAHPAGVRVAVHATELLNAQAALDGGADILVHSVDDAALTPKFIGDLKAGNHVYVTTAVVGEGYGDAFKGRPELLPIERKLGDPVIIQSLYEIPAAFAEKVAGLLPPSSIKQILVNAKTLVDSGVRVAAGTDAGNIGTLHGPAIHRELQLLSTAGLTPAQVLTAATRDAGFVYASKPDIGLIRPGYRADVLVLDADPLADVANLQKIATVWSRGKAIDPATLLPDTPESVVQRQLERYNAHDLDGFLGTYADEAQIFDLPHTKPSMSGKATMREVYGKLFAKYPQVHCRVANRIVEGRFVTDQEVCTDGSNKPPMHAGATYEVVNGAILRVWFTDPQAPFDDNK
ncbi:amidohydrolase family protein [Sphingomonas sinipercae]|uniref:Amidohydrolase family protein n=1 Tax=Sphingomonas sinipercae TaxID=2714944 RepID=A0A6G7ZLU0_9SPHN|nr:amidohydrolase family protein [Sphingomonas sinipercae]QIL01866.1 amidohydrolase family protein [Sphingomonas sinipercae]